MELSITNTMEWVAKYGCYDLEWCAVHTNAERSQMNDLRGKIASPTTCPDKKEKFKKQLSALQNKDKGIYKICKWTVVDSNDKIVAQRQLTEEQEIERKKRGMAQIYNRVGCYSGKPWIYVQLIPGEILLINK